MKNLFPIALFAVFMMVGCASSTSNEGGAPEPEAAVDTVAVKMEETKKEIEESSEELDQLLEDL